MQIDQGRDALDTVLAALTEGTRDALDTVLAALCSVEFPCRRCDGIDTHRDACPVASAIRIGIEALGRVPRAEVGRSNIFP